MIAVGMHECYTCERCACTFATVHAACPRCSEAARMPCFCGTKDAFRCPAHVNPVSARQMGGRT